MTNTDLLLQKISERGLKITFVADQLHLTYVGFMNKVNNKTEFKASEVAALKALLNLTDEETNQIFFDINVD